ncbi:MAG: RdgB/HAM1 family non-canonical purine NTP pyrophosphatase [Clostridiaceae bacterium]|nr:RdgB/HAM1 family non-canonical purine NTP pyrophosphatase [Clostridiaceae bacterium]
MLNQKRKLCLVATANQDKLIEIKEILRDFPLQVVAAGELGPEIEVEETAGTFGGNACLKAKAYREVYPDAYILSDDSGLCVDALNGQPGIYSARFGGTSSDYQKKSQLIWDMLRDKAVPETEWSARFVCALAWWEPQSSEPLLFNGEMEGCIIPERRGENGFGYDPIFFLPQYGQTSAEISPALKNRISHRGLALEKLKNYLLSNLPVINL